MDLQQAINQWRDCANNPVLYPSPSLRDACERAARSLEIERDTGVPVCTCHLVPTDECPRRKNNLK